jgi:ABC-type amino acid transport substrate-binding protein
MPKPFVNQLNLLHVWDFSELNFATTRLALVINTKSHEKWPDSKAFQILRLIMLTRPFHATMSAILFVLSAVAFPGIGDAGTLEDVKSKGVLTIGVRADMPPFGVIEQSGRTVGLDISIAEEIAKRLGVRLEMIPVTAAARIPTLQSGKIDLLLGGTAATAERAKVVDFSLPYLPERDTVMVKKDSTITKLEDLAGKKVSASPGTSGEQKLRELVPTAQIVNYQELTQAFLALKNGLVEGFVSGGLTLAKFSATQPGAFRIAEFSLLEYPTSIGVRKGEKEWLDTINTLLKKMEQDGTYAKIYDKWVGADSDYKLPMYHIR